MQVTVVACVFSKEIDLAAMLNGGISVGYSDNHYGHARNVINPGRARIMAEGWETARRVRIVGNSCSI